MITNLDCGLVPTLTVPALLHATGLWGSGCPGGSWVTFHVLADTIVLLLWRKIWSCSFPPLPRPTSFQTHTHNFCQPGCTWSPSLHVFAMSQKLIVSSTTACNLCTGGKQKATGNWKIFMKHEISPCKQPTQPTEVTSSQPAERKMHLSQSEAKQPTLRAGPLFQNFEAITTISNSHSCNKSVS